MLSQGKLKCLCISLIVAVLFIFISCIISTSLTPAFQKWTLSDKRLARPANPEVLRPSVPKKYRGLRNSIPRNEKNLTEGELLYDIHCSPCHGGNLDGNGPEAEGFYPRPANLINLVTAARPKESYLFYRIKEGGPGLPLEWRPWQSAMPAWGEELKDEEIWKIILYIYEAAGEVPPQ